MRTSAARAACSRDVGYAERMRPQGGTDRRDDGWADVDDASLLASAGGGDAAAVDAFVARFGDRLQSLLVRIVRDHAWADDLLQEVMVRALQDAHRYDPRWPLTVWLFRIARNLALDLLRREGRHRVRTGAAAARDAAAPAAVTTAEHREFQVAMEAALQELSEPFRTVFLLRDGEGLSYEEIAAVLSISVKTVSSRLNRARQQLREVSDPLRDCARQLVCAQAQPLQLREVPDPYYGAGDGFARVLDLIEQASMGLLADIRAKHLKG